MHRARLFPLAKGIVFQPAQLNAFGPKAATEAQLYKLQSTEAKAQEINKAKAIKNFILFFVKLNV